MVDPESYAAFKETTLEELHEETPLWEVRAEAPNFLAGLPPAALDEVAVRLVRELVDEGMAAVERRPWDEREPELSPGPFGLVTGAELDEVLEVRGWNELPPADDANYWLVPTAKRHAWCERLQLAVAVEKREREAAIDAALLRIGAMRRRRDVDGLLAELENRVESRTLAIRVVAAHALGDIRAVRAVDALCVLLGDADEGARIAAVSALAKIADPRAAPAILGLWRAGSPVQDWWVTYAAGELRAHEAVPVLFAALDSPDWPLRRLAAAALAKIGDASSAARLRDRARRERLGRRRPFLKAARAVEARARRGRS